MSMRKLSFYEFVDGASVTVKAVPAASAGLHGMCYFRCNKIQIHKRTSALFLPTLTHLCLTIVDSDTLAYRALLAGWWSLCFEVVCFELRDFQCSTARTVDPHTKTLDRAGMEGVWCIKSGHAHHLRFQLSI